MNINNDWKKTEDIEIDLADLLKKLCMQWKQILICALAFAVLGGGYGYMRNRSSAKVQSMDAVQDIELTQEEEQSVLAAVQLQEEIRGLEEYLDSSLLMQTDPYHRHKAYMLYSIEEADRRDVQKIAESYLSFVVNGGAAEALKKINKEWDVDKSYLAEIMTAYQRTYSYPYQVAVDADAASGMETETVFYVELTGLDEEMAERLADDMREVIKEYYAEVKKQAGNHKLTLAGMENTVTIDSSLQVQQHDKRAQLSSNTASLKTMTDAFSDKQMAIYEKKIEEAEKQLRKKEDSELLSENSTDGQQEAENQTGIEAKKGEGRTAILKYIILGFGGGIFLYCCIYVCRYLFQDTIKSTREIKELYVFPFYGCIPSRENKKSSKQTIISETGGQKAVQLVNRVRLACRKQGIVKLCFASGFLFDDREREYMELVMVQLNNFGIDVVTVENAEADTAQWDMLAETGTVLLVCRIGMTTHRMIDDAVRFYRENGVNVMGVMAFGFNE